MGLFAPPSTFQFSMLPMKISRSWSIVRFLTGFLGWTTMAMPSRATFSWLGLMPFASACLISLSSMARDDSAMSHVPLTRAVMPVPDPPPVTAILTPGVRLLKASAQAWPRLTIVSEPLIWTAFAFCGAEAPAAAATRARDAAKRAVYFLMFELLC